jgi:tungstate transport system ATP-binding protein
VKQAAGTDSSCALEASGLKVVLGGQQVLEIPSLQVKPGEVLVVIGPNGSGKTTLLLSLALLLRPASGTVAYRGIPIVEQDHILRQRRRLAVVFQEPLLLNSSAWDNVTLGLKLRGVPKEDIRQRAQAWLERFGVGDLARRQARTLSGGEAKRVSLARAFVLQPEVLFLDEPFAALDSPTRQALLEDFANVIRETRTTAVMVTHERNEALALGSRVAVLMNGSIRQVGSPAEVFSAPVDEDVAKFVGMENLLEGTIASCEGQMAVIDIKGTSIQAVSDCDIGERVLVGMRPEDITVALTRLSSSARNCLPGTVKGTVASGPLCRVEIDCGFTLVALVTTRSAAEMGLKNGTQVYAAFKAVSLHVIRH